MTSTSAFGARARPPRPVLLALVYGTFLVIVGVTATMQAVLVGTHFSAAALSTIVETDGGVVRAFADEHLRPGDFGAALLAPAREAELRAALTAFAGPRAIVRVEVRRPDATVLVSDAQVAGQPAPENEDVSRALDEGQASASFLDRGRPAGTTGGALPEPQLLREAYPLVADGRVLGVVALWRDAAPILARLEAVRTDILVVTCSAGLVAAAALYLVFRAAQARISRQTAALMEASRRDPLTGTLNHGSLVEVLAGAIERRRGTPDPAIAIALVDIDNFRALNDTHGHGAGDEALLVLVDRLRASLGPDALLGRYGPDELLVAQEGVPVGVLAEALGVLRTELAGVGLEVPDGDPLPLTVSAALCSFPEHGDSVTELLAIAAITLQEAKASGGDAVRRPSRESEPGVTRTFDVFQGLILAVDTKDRYTKRHSEDVARYALFIARRSGVPAGDLEAIRVAGLLHDVGKIGIPDHVLRKPGKLTDEEYGVVKQHVALGDMIVRDLPDIETVRAGIRHHHERVDGRGYLHGLAGDDIPLVARILAVADAFSAMTTSRPYRKALDVGEALRRLEDAAGTQLEERLVVTFVNGLETDADAPMPGDDGGRLLWLPSRRVA
jgi:diguanylate cyclase (GGDEF)-like protein